VRPNKNVQRTIIYIKHNKNNSFCCRGRIIIVDIIHNNMRYCYYFYYHKKCSTVQHVTHGLRVHRPRRSRESSVARRHAYYTRAQVFLCECHTVFYRYLSLMYVFVQGESCVEKHQFIRFCSNTLQIRIFEHSALGFRKFCDFYLQRIRNITNISSLD